MTNGTTKSKVLPLALFDDCGTRRWHEATDGFLEPTSDRARDSVTRHGRTSTASTREGSVGVDLVMENHSEHQKTFCPLKINAHVRPCRGQTSLGLK